MNGLEHKQERAWPPYGVTDRGAGPLLRASVGGAVRSDDALEEVPSRARTSRTGQLAAMSRRAHELGARVQPDVYGVGLVAGVVSGNLRLLLGMLRANRPWRLAIRLSRALFAALAAGVFALVTSDIWRLADSLGPVRLVLIAVVSVVAVVSTVVVGAGLWERVPPGSTAREQVILFNVVTVTTVVIGVLALYVSLLVFTLIGAVLLVPASLLANTQDHPTGIPDQLNVAWLAASIATLGGALGAGLESDAAVREAAYGYQPDELSRNS